MASIAQWLVTLHFVDEFTFALADAQTDPRAQEGNRLWQAEVDGYLSILGDLVAEAEDFQAKHIRIHENEDDGYFAALMDAMGGMTGIGVTPEMALRDLRLKIEAALGFTMENNNELPQADA